ncbi:type VII secretion-associated serine protease mycosin [Streptomyces griseoaurantiacus]|uniref:type VII secretion-associated serine protease mycosin n=1 Tax=Streptomyces griseoaurantiacus TaxID=68213 RepID=UPI0017824541|nr:type VII secretion-associated serine protease [Streptomyces griseoaurantiacus]
MRIDGKRSLRLPSTALAVLGLLLVGVSATPAYADTVRARQWHLDAMRADDMWKTSTGRGITVAVIDSGVDDTLADLRGQVLEGRDFSAQRGNEHTDIAGHGTGIAALIAATGSRGAVNGSYGLAPGTKILPVRMRYNEEEFGQVDAGAEYARVLTKAIRYASDSKAQIINISMATANSPGRKNVGTPALAAAVRYALAKGKLIFAGAGNSGDTSNRPQYPASTPGVVGVGAITPQIKRASFSQHGSEVDITAPGVSMYHACPGGTQVCESEGTSDATAIASASAALIWAAHPDWTNNQVLRVLINTMKGNEESPTRNDDFGYGIVRPRAALQDPGDPGPADEYPLPDLEAAASKSASPAASKSSEAADSDRAEGSHGTVAAPQDEDGNTTLWIALGISAAALLGTAIVVLSMRARRNRPNSPFVPAAPPVPPAHQPYAPPQQQDPPYAPPPPRSHTPGSPPDGAPRQPGQQ